MGQEHRGAITTNFWSCWLVELGITSIPQISIAVAMFFINKSLPTKWCIYRQASSDWDETWAAWTGWQSTSSKEDIYWERQRNLSTVWAIYRVTIQPQQFPRCHKISNWAFSLKYMCLCTILFMLFLTLKNWVDLVRIDLVKGSRAEIKGHWDREDNFWVSNSSESTSLFTCSLSIITSS